MKTIPINFVDFATRLNPENISGAYEKLDDGIYEIEDLYDQMLYIAEVKNGCLNGFCKTFKLNNDKTEHRISSIYFHEDNVIEGERLTLVYEDIVTFPPNKRINTYD